jgi:hypothetical protein
LAAVEGIVLVEPDGAVAEPTPTLEVVDPVPVPVAFPAVVPDGAVLAEISEPGPLSLIFPCRSRQCVTSEMLPAKLGSEGPVADWPIAVETVPPSNAADSITIVAVFIDALR